MKVREAGGLRRGGDEAFPFGHVLRDLGELRELVVVGVAKQRTVQRDGEHDGERQDERVAGLAHERPRRRRVRRFRDRGR